MEPPWRHARLQSAHRVQVPQGNGPTTLRSRAALCWTAAHRNLQLVYVDAGAIVNACDCAQRMRQYRRPCDHYAADEPLTTDRPLAFKRTSGSVCSTCMLRHCCHRPWRVSVYEQATVVVHVDALTLAERIGTHDQRTVRHV